jgi:hypothetical protein
MRPEGRRPFAHSNEKMVARLFRLPWQHSKKVANAMSQDLRKTTLERLLEALLGGGDAEIRRDLAQPHSDAHEMLKSIRKNSRAMRLAHDAGYTESREGRAFFWRSQPVLVAAMILVGVAICGMAIVGLLPDDDARSWAVVVRDGSKQVGLDKDGQLRGFDPLPSDPGLLKEALQGRLDLRVAKSLRDEQNVEAGSPSDGETFATLSPVGVTVREDRPRFRWGSLVGAEGYIVYIIGPDGYREDSGRLPANDGPIVEWHLPTDKPALNRGGEYRWQVVALKRENMQEKRIPSPARTDPQSRFRVLTEDELSTINRTEIDHANSPLTLGVAYAKAGLLADSTPKLQLLQEANPESPEVRQLLQSVKSLLEPRQRVRP